MTDVGFTVLTEDDFIRLEGRIAQELYMEMLLSRNQATEAAKLSVVQLRKYLQDKKPHLTER